ncbi:hypothetical protein [Actinophytocola oryzae]|uniref:Uncharacterized protein n=1 Tax=Actinophytocola oryzae TaxID=502181 RepID=A0A4R7UYF1_9PSEU|nr:hypothetical protein [Actinophytocola oryzae]TDV40106.1 hypothetical protein CLV71_124125 [Actinophytocola oryzae]
MSTRDRRRPAHTGRLPLNPTTPQHDQQAPTYGARVTDDRAEFEARRAAAMPARHAQRLRNLAASPDARQRLADTPVFAPLFLEPQDGDRSE